MIDLFADIQIHDINELTNSHSAYSSLVPNDDELIAERDWEQRFEKQAPNPDATKLLAKLIGMDTRAPIIRVSFVSL